MYNTYYVNEKGYSSMYVDQHGRPVERTPMTHPYSYSPYMVCRNGENKEATNTIYSDHLYKFSHGEDSWDHSQKMAHKHFGNAGQEWHLSERPADKIEEFLRDYFDKPSLKLVYMLQGCHLASGFPIWEFHLNMGD